VHVTTKVPVNASKHDVWRVITDIENAPNTISGIDEVEILNKPPEGLVGLKWKETRTLFGKTATETMWITEAVEDDYYATEARSHGSVYRSKIYVSEQDGMTELGMDFDAEAQSFAAKVIVATMGFMIKKGTKKALLQDLNDVKAAVEKG
jgi:carbon monoxide dehydrogenase subunit G